jgi:FkbM family methyltransferase
MMINAASVPFLSYSANNEDVLLHRIFGDQVDGFFVDVGAAHPLFENDTRALYERGWRGINIEPTAAFYRELVAQRPNDINLNIAISDEPGELSFHEVVGTGLSTCDAKEAASATAKGFDVVHHTVSARTLRDILQEAKLPKIDLLKVDVEGFELRVMKSNDWSLYRPRIVVAEGTFPESPVRRNDGVADYLAAQGYRHVYFDGLNDFYAEQDFALPVEVFDRPVNIFDRFVPFAQRELSKARDSLFAQVKALQQEKGNAQDYILSLEQEKANANQYVSALLEKIDGLEQERESSALYISSLSDQINKDRVAIEGHVVDLDNAYAELIFMRSRGEALAAALDSITLQLVVAHRQAQERAKQPSMEHTLVARELASVYASNSWRVTRPLRALARPRRTLAVIMARFLTPT